MNPDFKEQVKSSLDIVKVIGEYIPLKRSGTGGRYIGLCPFHQEKTPSFSVNQTRQFYKCFGCNAGGDVFNFVMELDGLTFPEALKLLAERTGIPMPQRTEYADAESKLRAALLDMHSIAAELFQTNLRSPHGAEARAYLDRRGISPEMTETFGVGYSESSGQSLLRRLTHFTPEQLDASGLVRRRDDGSGSYDYFRGRLMFPIHNESGKVIGFGGRAMRDEDQPKYLNSPETPIYRKSSVLYNVHRAKDAMRKLERAVLVEGYMDVIGVYAAGVTEVVASCGTSLTSAQVGIMRRLTDGKTIVVLYDPDKAGANASEKALQLLVDEDPHVRVLTLDDGLDPDEYVRKYGAARLKEKIDSASSYFYWLADRARQRFDIRTTDGKMGVYKFLVDAVQKVSNRFERAVIAHELTAYLGVESGIVLDQFNKAAAERRAPQKAAPAAALPALEQMLVHALISSEEARTEVLPKLPPAATQAFATREIIEVLRHLTDSGSPVTFSAIEGRLDGPSKTLLHQIVAADESSDGARSLEQAQACLRRLEADQKKRRLDEIGARAKTAEREGRLEEALKLNAERERLRKSV